MSYKTKKNCQSPWFEKKPGLGLGRLALTRSQGGKGVGPGLGYGLSSNVPVRRHDNAIRHGSR